MKFNEVMDLHKDMLLLYVPTVKRVHGESHPEFYEISDLFESIMDKYESSKDLHTYLDDFDKLKEATSNYQVPGDVCETYAKVYEMLEEIDTSYRQVL